MQIHLRTGERDAKIFRRMEVLGMPSEFIPQRGSYGTNNNVIVFSDEDGRTFLADRNSAEKDLKEKGYRLTGANVLFSQCPEFLLAELRGDNQHIPEDVRIRNFQKAYSPQNEMLWYFPN